MTTIILGYCHTTFNGQPVIELILAPFYAGDSLHSVYALTINDIDYQREGVAHYPDSKTAHEECWKHYLSKSI